MISSQDGTDARRGRPAFFAGLAGSCVVPFAAATVAGTSGWPEAPGWSAGLGWLAGAAASAVCWLRAGAGELRRSKSRAGSG